MRKFEIFNPQKKRFRMIRENLNSGLTLDLGSANGELHDFLLQNTECKVIGVDKIKNKNVDKVHDLDEMPYPFPSDYAGNIVAGELIEHLANPLGFLNECFRILKPKGRLVITTPNMTGLQYLLGAWKNLENPSSIHLYSWNEDLFTYLVEKTKFKIKRIELFTAYWNRNIVFRLIAYLIPRIRTTIFLFLKNDIITRMRH